MESERTRPMRLVLLRAVFISALTVGMVGCNRSQPSPQSEQSQKSHPSDQTFATASATRNSEVATTVPLEEFEQFKFRIQSNAHAEAQAGGISSQPSDKPDEVSATATGQEKSDPGGGEERQSAANASASFRAESMTEDRVAATLAANTTANGGHRVRCSATVLDSCIGRNGEDSEGSAAAKATASIHLEFAKDARPVHYTMNFGGSFDSQGAALSITFSDSEGKVLIGGSEPRLTASFVGDRDRTFLLAIGLAADSADRGGSGRVTHRGVLNFVLTVRRSPILEAEAVSGTALASDGEEIRIVGGEPTADYPEVGAILLQGAMHCTGTLIGANTVLTAGHCLYRHEAKDMVFVQGQYALKLANPRAGTSKALPNDAEFRYRERPITDDLGLLYIANPSATTWMTPHVGMPKLDSLVQTQEQLAFVGYGYNVVQGKKIGLGTKRHVDMPISSLSPRRFTYRVLGKNTCNGDSGGPAFASDYKALWIAGITSTGDRGCTDHGTDVRVEAYSAWIKPRIR